MGSKEIGTVGKTEGLRNGFHIITKQQHDEWNELTAEPPKSIDCVLRCTSTEYHEWKQIDCTPNDEKTQLILLLSVGVIPAFTIVTMLLPVSILVKGAVIVSALIASISLLEYVLLGEFKSFQEFKRRRN